MHIKTYSFTNASVNYYFDASFASLKKLVNPKTTVLITDQNIVAVHNKKFKDWNTIVLKAGEEFKVQQTVDSIIRQLIEMQADRKWTIIAVGGGVVTDITGYVASIFLRGVAFGFVPTTILGMVDAAIGGKNGVDVDVYKNMVGTINQPEFILYDINFLKTLPDNEWRNGFAEIIKHACIRDAAMFKALEDLSLPKIKKSKEVLVKLVQRNALLKTKIVQEDEFEKNQRRLLNFGHTLGHALEKTYEFSHGEAISIGMAFATELSASFLKFKAAPKVISLIDKYDLPVAAGYNKRKVFEVLLQDKKREGDHLNFILLEKIGKAVIKKLPLDKLYSFI